MKFHKKILTTTKNHFQRDLRYVKMLYIEVEFSNKQEIFWMKQKQIWMLKQSRKITKNNF